jgi:hypothetical protein
MATKIILSTVLFLSAACGFTQSVFYKTYGGSGYDTGQDVIQLESDSSFLIVGSSSSSGPAPNQVLVMQVDKYGEFLKAHFFGGLLSDIGVRIMHKENEGYWIAGYSNSFSADANFDFYLIKLNENFELEWQKTYGSSNWERLWDAILLPDNGVLMVGEVEGLGHEGKDVYMVRTDESGEVLWKQTNSGPKDDVAYGCALFDNSSFVVCGKWGEEEALPWVCRMNFDGTLIWSRNDYLEGENEIGEYREIRKTQNFLYCVGNWTPLHHEETNYRPIRSQLFLTGDLLFNRYDFSLMETGVSMVVVAQDEIYITVESRNPAVVGSNGPRCAIFRYNEFLGFLPQFDGFTVFGAKVHAKKMLRTLDVEGRYALVGFTEDQGMGFGGANVFLLKIDGSVQSLENVVFNPILALESYHDAGFSFYPNPTNSSVSVQLPDTMQALDFTVFDILGKKIMSGIFQTELDFSSLDAGQYQLVLSTNQGTKSIRFQKF